MILSHMKHLYIKNSDINHESKSIFDAEIHIKYNRLMLFRFAVAVNTIPSFYLNISHRQTSFLSGLTTDPHFLHHVATSVLHG